MPYFPGHHGYKIHRELFFEENSKWWTKFHTRLARLSQVKNFYKININIDV